MKAIALFFISILFIGCTHSSLKLTKKEELVFNYNSSAFLLSSSIVDSKLLNYKDLFVKQYKLEDENSRVLFYEDARTELNYEFNFSGLYTVMYIFDDAKEYEEVYRKNNLRLIQLKLKDKKSVNVLIQASDTQIISYVYGFSNEEFLKLATKLVENSDEEIKQLKYEGTTLSKSQSPLTNWNDKLVYFTPLITPLRMIGGR